MIKKTAILMFISSLFLLQGCYDDYKEDYQYTTTYFARQFPLRTLVDEEGKDMTFEIGTVLGGKYSNDIKEEVAFQIQDSFLNADNFSQFTKLPDNYYSLESNNIEIPSGHFKGQVTVTLDKELFLNDPLAVENTYALPVEITDTSLDSILANKHYSVIVIKYFNKYHGWYYTKGIDNKLDGANAPIESERLTYQYDDVVSNSDILFNTTNKNSLLGSYDGVTGFIGTDTDNIASRANFDIALEINDDNTVTVFADDNNGFTNINGTGSYDPATRNFTIEYNYTDADGAMHAVTEELIYRNTELVLEEWQ